MGSVVNLLSGALDSLILEADGDILDSHVTCQELLHIVNAISWWTVEWIAHGTSVRVKLILQSTETVRIVALAFQSLFNLTAKKKYKYRFYLYI